MLAHFGQSAPRLANILATRGALHRYWTGFAFPDGGPEASLARMLPGRRARRLERRMVPGLTRDVLRVRPLTELCGLAWLLAGRDYDSTMYARNALLQRAVDPGDIRAADVVVGYDTCSWILARKAHDAGRPFILVQSTVHSLTKNDLYPRIRDEHPEWFEDVRSKRPEHLEIEQAEHLLADCIVTSSNYSRSTLVANGVDPAKVTVVPYGVDAAMFAPASSRSSNRPFRFVYTGLVNARKGAHVLLDAWRRVRRSDDELWLVGTVSDSASVMLQDVPGLTLLGHRPQSELPALLSQCDAFVFPSLFEGFGMVILEALAMGLPVIATQETVAPDLDDGSGAIKLVPGGNVEALAAAMAAARTEWASGGMQSAARAIAEHHSWNRYGDAWLRLVMQVAEQGSVLRRVLPTA